jgi:predicted patatin/cPLA2 family phospholipase
MRKKRALILGSGGIAGAYSAGFVCELSKKFPPEYFDTIYGCSVGVFASSFYLAKQPKIIDYTWRNCVDGRKLINPLNFFIGKRALDLDYLIALFKNGPSKLNIDSILKSKTKLYSPLINFHTGKLSCKSLKCKDIFNIMKAATSMPIACGESRVGKEYYLDSVFVYGGIPFLEKISEEYEEVIVLLNFPRKYSGYWINRLAKLFFYPFAKIFYPNKLREVFNKKWKTKEESEKFMEKSKNIIVLRPEKEIFLTSGMDTNRERILHLMDLGKNDAKKFIKSRN